MLLVVYKSDSVAMDMPVVRPDSVAMDMPVVRPDSVDMPCACRQTVLAPPLLLCSGFPWDLVGDY